jgi:parvulin-like peptidyl-prolyl isomerase
MKRLHRILMPLLAAVLLPAGRAADSPAATNAASPAKPADKLDGLFPDAVLAKGKGVEVRQSQLDKEVINAKSQLAARGQNVPPEQMAGLELEILNRLIRLQLLEGKATDADKAAGKEAAQKQFDQALAQMGSEATLNRQLKLLGTTRDELMSKLTEQGTAEAVVTRQLKTVVTDDDVKKFYTSNPSKFEQPEMVRASHVLLATRDLTANTDLPDEQKAAKHKLAEEVLKRARAGEDFAELAKKYSEDPGSKDKGGEYIFPRGQMAPDFEHAAFALNTNQVSDIVTTMYGFHIIKLSEKVPARAASLDDEVAFSPTPPGYVVVIKYYPGTIDTNRWLSGKLSDLIRKQMETDQVRKQLPDFLAQLRKDANVEILDENLKAEETAAEARQKADASSGIVSPSVPK